MKLSIKKRISVIIFTSALIVSMVVSAFATYAAVSDWCKVFIKQSSVGRGSGCTACTFHLILLNSGTIKPEYACTGLQSSMSGNFAKLDADTNNGAGYHQGDSWVVGNFASCAGTVTTATWTWVNAVDGNSSFYNENSYIVGFGGKDFEDMTYAEQLAAMKAVWNAGYYTVVGVKYGNDYANSNGPSGHRARHATMLAGVDADNIYLNDPATGSIRNYKDATNSGKAYKIVYLILFKCSAGKACDNPGTTVAPITNADKIAGSNIGFSVANLTGDLYNERDLAAKAVVDEVDISDSFLADRSDLEQEDLNNLAMWEDNVHTNSSKSSPIYWLRVATMFLGIIVIVWSVLLYLAYWFDRLNSFFDIDMLGILTLGRLHMSDTEEECNFSIKNLGSTERKTVNHRAIIGICITGIAFGVLIISGLLYSLLTSLINFVLIALGQS